MKKKISLKWKIAKYLGVFSAGLIALLALFQIVLLEPMYEKSRMNSVKAAASMVSAAFTNQDTEDLLDTIYTVSAQSDTCIRIIYGGTDYATGNMGCVLYRMSSEDLYRQKQKAENNGNEYLDVMQSSVGIPGGRVDLENFKSIIATKLVDVDDSTAMIMVYAGLTPVNATTQTLTTQIFYIAGIVLISIIVLIWLLYRRIARPLMEINSAAKHLPEGKYPVSPKSNAYQEAQELNETLTQAAIDIQKADQAKRDLISNVSHDLRTPLTMISGYGEMMRDLPGEKTDENIQVIIDESHRLNNLVNDLLDLAKLEEGKITIHPDVFSLTNLIQRNMRKYDVFEAQDQFTFDVQVEENLNVKGDEKRIEQVFNNFMSNAIHYSGDSRKVIIRAFTKENHVRVEVQDFGEGIPQDKIKDIWERYYKIDREHVRNMNSSGIGLSIVKEILELHQTPYGVESQLNQGSTFWFELEKE